MSFSDFQTVVRGEASETDDEEEMFVTSGAPMASSAACGVKVQGEASETDEEEDEPGMDRDMGPSRVLEKDLPPLVVIRDEAAGGPGALEERPLITIRQPGRYSTLLQQKLLESNARLSHDVCHTVRLVYQNSTNEIRALTSQLSQSQNGIINASHSIRLALEDLKGVADKIDIITSCDLLPDIRLGPIN